MQQIADWLEKLGMPEYTERFNENGIDISVLPHLTDQDLKDLKLPMLRPGITVYTSAGDFAPIKQMQLEKFDGTTFQPFGEVISGSGS